MTVWTHTLLTAVTLAVVACDSNDARGVESVEVQLEALLANYRGDDRPAACILARHRGAVIYESCLGMAELETGRAATPEANFRLASVTKQFTATAVLRLVQDGALATTTTLRQVFPDFPPYGDAVTVHHLLTHTSGLIAYEDLLLDGDTTQIKDVGVLGLMKRQDSTYFPPGLSYRYSNSGYALLAQIVEAVTGKPFPRVLTETIFEPLSMTGTVAHEEGLTTVGNRAYGYSRLDDGTWLRTDQSRTSAVLGDGGIYSSLRDLNTWMAVVEGRRPLLRLDVAAPMFEEAVLSTGEGVGYGYGWHLDTYRRRPRYRHEGSTIGFRNEIQRFPGEDLSVVFLSNRNEVSGSLPDAIADVFLKRLERGR